MSRSRIISLSTPADRLELLLAFVGIVALIGLYAATIAVLRLCIALGWYVS
ncbi:hypothetical protein [Rhodococcus sp. ACPA1]|uniref:hypothetical protein n=1 Tax=Rhodococcus sp. ACPA1 TaxID=2028572 RepID=UPI0015C8E21C|nr:hypothetical protein [Rhodococcus sp. ACPA1]